MGSIQDLSEPLRPGRNYSYNLTFTNPLYEAIEVTLEILSPSLKPPSKDLQLEEAEKQEEKESDSKQPWMISLPGKSFGIDAYAEAWEYEGDSDNDAHNSGSSRGKRYGPGIVTKKGNKTVVQLDLAVGREAWGSVRVRV